MDRRVCHVLGCPRQLKGQSFHCMPNPKKSMDLFSAWFRLLGNPKFLNMDPMDIFKRVRVCGRHFRESDYLPRNHLKEGTIPS